MPAELRLRRPGLGTPRLVRRSNPPAPGKETPTDSHDACVRPARRAAPAPEGRAKTAGGSTCLPAFGGGRVGPCVGCVGDGGWGPSLSCGRGLSTYSRPRLTCFFPIRYLKLQISEQRVEMSVRSIRTLTR